MVKAGEITKPYGLRGDLIVILEPGREHFVQAGNPLFIEIDGQRVPFFMEEAEIVDATQAILKFEWIESVEEAREICGCPVFLDPSGSRGMKFPEDERSEIVGYAAEDEELGHLGRVTGFYSHEMNPVWIVDRNGKELIVPAAEPFIKEIDHSKKIITFRLPEGLAEL